MTIKQALENAYALLSPISQEARLEAELLLAYVLKVDRPMLIAHDDQIVSTKQVTQFMRLIDDRVNHKPLAYLVHKKAFMRKEFFVTQDVLIPRPETELLVEYVLSWCSQRPTPASGWQIADVGTGSGVIAVTLAASLPHAKVHAIDVSRKALDVAKKNAALHHVVNAVTFHKGSLIEPLTDAVDIIVANLPYIPSDRIQTLEPEVKEWEPTLALDGGNDGFELYRQLLLQISHLKTYPQLMLMEVDYLHGEYFKRTITDMLPYYSVLTQKDLAKYTRFFVCELKQPTK